MGVLNKKATERVKPFVGSMVVAGAIMLLVGIFLGYYYEDNQAMFVNLLYYAQPNETLVTEWMTDFDFLLVPFWAVLCQKVKVFPVYALWQLLQVYTWLCGFLYFFFTRLPVKKQGWALLLTICILLVAITLDSLVSQICFRNSILMAAAGLLYTYDDLKQAKRTSWLAKGLFVLALFPRMHAAAVVLAFFIAFETLAGLGFWRVIKAHGVHIAASVLVIGTYQIYGIYGSLNTGKVIESKYEYAALEKHSFAPMADMHTLRDSTKLVMLKQFFLSDTAEMNLAFIEKGVDLKGTYLFAFSLSNIQKGVLQIKQKFVEQPALFLIFILLNFLVFFFKPLPVVKCRVIVISAVYLAVISAMVLFLVDELKDRFFIPFTGVVIIVLAVEAAELLNYGYRRLLLLPVLILGFWQSVTGIKLSNDYKAVDATTSENLKKLEPYTQTHLVMAGVGVPGFFVRDIFYRHPSSYTNVTWFDLGYMVYYPYMEARFRNVHGHSPTNMKALLHAFEKPTVRLWMVENRARLTQLYFRNMYRVGISLQRDTLAPVFDNYSAFYNVYVNRSDSAQIPANQLYLYEVKSF